VKDKNVQVNQKNSKILIYRHLDKNSVRTLNELAGALNVSKSTYMQ